MQFENAAGVLLHVTSLPAMSGEGWATKLMSSGVMDCSVDLPSGQDAAEVSPAEVGLSTATLSDLDFGVGDMGPAAFRFVDFLKRSGQRVWQVLPLSPTSYGDSPYSSYSAFAGNPLLISLEGLVLDGLLEPDQLYSIYEQSQHDGDADPARCDYAFARQVKTAALQAAFETFMQGSKCQHFDEFESFCVQRRWWLDDFALFATLREHFGTEDWTTWPSELVHRESKALGEYRERLSREFEYHQFVQFDFHRQWSRLRTYANQNDVALFGDMPIFVAHGSADVWANQSGFKLDGNGKPLEVAGVPPDYFSKNGQLWGNPLYNWEEMKAQGYRWWVKRLEAAFESFDLLRIDHFRAFESYWAVPAGAKTARGGEWKPGPGVEPFEAARNQLGELPIVAEDLGLITEEVHQLRDQLAFPGMRVLQFGFDNEHDGYHRPNEYPENCVAYTGTHDNSTTMAWYRSGTESKTRCELLEPWLEEQPQDMRVHWQLLSMIYKSDASLAIAPMQDILGLGDDARMNMPGEAQGNWQWRLEASELNDDLADQLRDVCKSSGRAV